jgi:hypothetical protein
LRRINPEAKSSVGDLNDGPYNKSGGLGAKATKASVAGGMLTLLKKWLKKAKGTIAHRDTWDISIK